MINNSVIIFFYLFHLCLIPKKSLFFPLKHFLSRLGKVPLPTLQHITEFESIMALELLLLIDSILFS